MKTRLFALLVLSTSGALFAGNAPKAAAPDRRIDVNRATEAELMTLPGVNRETARRLIARRPFPNQAKFLDALGLPPAQMQIVATRAVVGGAPEPLLPAPGTKTTPPKAPESKPESGPATRVIKADAENAPASPAVAAPLPYERRVDVNTGSLEEIEGAARLDALTAGVIVANRPYRSLSELSKAGFLHEKIVELSHYLKVSAQK